MSLLVEIAHLIFRTSGEKLCLQKEDGR